MDELGAPRRKRIRLKGARFDGGRLPVDSLVELQRYQEVVRKLAEQEWLQDHPGESLPADFEQGVGLTIEKIDEGSADVWLLFEQHAVYQQYQAEAQEAADATLVAAYSHAPLPELDGVPEPAVREIRGELAQIGESLAEGQSIEFFADPADESPTVITVETRRDAVRELILDDFLMATPPPSAATGLTNAGVVSLIGRVTAVDAESTRFEFVTPQGTVHGWYRTNSELLADLRKLLDTAAEGPLTRITGDLQLKNGVPNRFWIAHAVERVEFDDSPAGKRLTEFALLPPGWGDGESEQISFVALEAAQEIVRALGNDVPRPGLFPTSEGGVLIEWANGEGVRSIEILPDGLFELFEITHGDRYGQHSETTNLADAIAFAHGGVVV